MKKPNDKTFQNALTLAATLATLGASLGVPVQQALAAPPNVTPARTEANQHKDKLNSTNREWQANQHKLNSANPVAGEPDRQFVEKQSVKRRADAPHRKSNMQESE